MLRPSALMSRPRCTPMIACEVTTSRYSFTSCPSTVIPVVRINVSSFRLVLAGEAPRGVDAELGPTVQEPVRADAAGEADERVAGASKTRIVVVFPAPFGPRK